MVVGTKFTDYVAEVEANATPEGRELLDAYDSHFTAERQRILEIPRALAVARTRLGLTQKQLAELADVQQSEISRIESGQANPTMETLNRLAAPLHAHLALVDDQGRVLSSVEAATV